MPDDKAALSRQHASSMLLLGLGAVAVGYFGWKASRPIPTITQAPLELKKPLSEPPPKTQFMVVIRGAIKKPGTYSIDQGKRLAALIEMAGGITSEADHEKIPSTEILRDGKLYVIPAIKPKKVIAATRPRATTRNESRKSESPSVDASMAGVWTINLNSADAELLLQLPKISEEQVRHIEDYRIKLGGFRGPSDLKQVPKISQYDIRRWTPYLRFSGPELIGEIR